MKVTVKNQLLVKPSEPTWNGFIPLSDFDLIGTLSHIATVHFYNPPSTWHSSPDSIFQTLKSSLAKTLIPFYPLAGRLSPAGRGGRYLINCCSAGALLAGADSDAGLADVTDSDLRELVPSVDIKTMALEEYPLLVAQVTRFACGGVSVGIAMSHAVLDGIGAAYVIRQWARIARGEALDEEPFLDRSLLVNMGEGVAFPQKRPPEFDEVFGSLDCGGGGNSPPATCSWVKFRLTESQVELLREKANDGSSTKFTRFEAITAHMWRTACKSFRHAAHRQTRLGISVNLRPRLGLPKSYLGNAVLDVTALSTAGDLVTGTLSHTAAILRQTIDRVTVEYLKSTCAFLKGMDDLSCFQGGGSGGGEDSLAELLVSSWMTLDLEGIDFGWGKEERTAPVESGREGECLIQIGDGESRQSIQVVICLREGYVEDFERLFLEEII